MRDVPQKPERKPAKPYNPLERRQLAESIGRRLLEQEVSALPPKEAVNGAGVYLIYYRGDFPLYAPISTANRGKWRVPIYAGKADPPGGRKGTQLDESTSASTLHRRLCEHAETIQSADNLHLEHFACRCLVVEDIWVGLAEALLIEQYHPLWNGPIDGFGLHRPGAPREKGQRPSWYTLHPGRGWASGMPTGRHSLEQLEQKAREHMARHVG